MLDKLVYVIKELAVFWLPFSCLAILGFQLQKYYVAGLQRAGGRYLLLLPAFFSVPIHELSHYCAAKLCGHNVTEMKLFTVNKSGTLGYVNHEYRPTMLSPICNMIIGMAPLVGAALSVIIVTHGLMPELLELYQTPVVLNSENIISVLVQYAKTFLHTLGDHHHRWQFWLWYWLVANVTVFGIPSSTDFKGAFKGIIVVLIVYIMAVTLSGPGNVMHVYLIKLVAIYTPILTLSMFLVSANLPPLYLIATWRRRNAPSML